MIKARKCFYCLKGSRPELLYSINSHQNVARSVCHRCRISFLKEKKFDPETRKWTGKRKPTVKKVNKSDKIYGRLSAESVKKIDNYLGTEYLSDIMIMDFFE